MLIERDFSDAAFGFSGFEASITMIIPCFIDRYGLCLLVYIVPSKSKAFTKSNSSHSNDIKNKVGLVFYFLASNLK